VAKQLCGGQVYLVVASSDATYFVWVLADFGAADVAVALAASSGARGQACPMRCRARVQLSDELG
jgi:hypothetical protein